MSKLCDRCDRYILNEQSFYHCSHCGGGDYDICESCFSAGKRCSDEQHTLLHYRLRGDAVVGAETGNLVQYTASRSCPGCSWDKNGKPQDDHPFKYETFPDDSYMRVIDLSPGADDQPLRYSLHYARLDALPKAQYVAISYVCGDVSAKVLSYCNGRRLDIYASLDHALRKWRTTPKQNWLRIWADAISINQDDNQEKSAQVARMHKIYRQANQIFVDLGNAPEGVELAIEVLLKASRAFDESRKVQGPSQPSQPGSYHNHRPPATEVSVTEALALSRFAELIYFTRLWVVQEVCLWDVFTAFPPIFLCGHHSIQWIDLIGAASQLGGAPLQFKYGPEGITPELESALVEAKSWGPPVVAIFLEYYKMISKQGPSQNLHWFLQRAWELKSTNPADKVYGLLGFVNDQYAVVHSGTTAGHWRDDGLAENPDGKKEIRVDYALPFRTVYEDVCRLTLKEENSLDPLADAGSGKSKRSPHLPSWVPDWNNYPEERALVSRFGPATTSKYCASLETKPIPLYGGLSGLLEVDAYLVDAVQIEAARYCGEENVIDTTSDASLRQRQISSLKKHILSLWWCFGVKFNKYPSGERPFDVFWRTLVANRVTVVSQNVVPTPNFAESFLMAYPEILEVETTDAKPECICPEWAIIETQRKQQHDMLHDHVDHHGGAEQERPVPIRDKYPRPGELFGDDLPLYGEHYVGALRQAALGRRFFRTRGGYMGVGPRNLTRHDSVVVLKGGSLPFLLRRTDGFEGKSVYTLLGEAYIHGISDGEALRDFQDAEHDPRWTRVTLT